MEVLSAFCGLTWYLCWADAYTKSASSNMASSNLLRLGLPSGFWGVSCHGRRSNHEDRKRQ